MKIRHQKQDLESALYYMLKKEASAKTEYTEDEDETIRSLIKILGLHLAHLNQP